MCKIPEDHKRWPIEDRLADAVEVARQAYQDTLAAGTPAAVRQENLRVLEVAVNRLLDYVMMDIHPDMPMGMPEDIMTPK